MDAKKPIAAAQMKKGLRSKDSCQRMEEAPASQSTSEKHQCESDFHSKTLHRLAKKAASTCPGGVLSSNAFFEAYSILRKPIEVATHDKKLAVMEDLDHDKERQHSVPFNAEEHATDGPDEHACISSIAHLLDIQKFDMLERPKTEKKWGKVSKAVQEKSIAVAQVKAKDPIQTVDPTDLLLFYYSKHRNTVW